MKQKNTELPAYLFMSVFAVILIGIIIYCTKNFFDSTTGAADNVIENTQDLSSDYIDYDIKIFDGEEVRGSEVANFIKKQIGDYDSTETAPIYVKVVTVISGATYTNTYENKEHIADIKDFSIMQYYIKPTALFSGKVIKTANDAIVGINFVQK